jgi:hypothetical protein
MRRSRNSHEVLCVTATRQGVSYIILHTTAVNNAIAQTQQLSEYSLLPWCMQTLFIEMNQALLVSMDEEFILQEIVAPLINSHDDC